MTIGDRIKGLREDSKITQEQLAKYIKSTKQTIYKYENNIITNIPSDKIEKIAKALNSTPAYLMGWTAEKRKVEKKTYDMTKTPLYKAISKLEIGEKDLNNNEINSIVKYIEFIKSQK